jgi:hypothetical protein
MREIELDRLLEKHEYFGYDEADAKSMTVDVAGVPTRVLVPGGFPDVEPIVVADRGDMLFIVGELYHAPREVTGLAPVGCGRLHPWPGSSSHTPA